MKTDALSEKLLRVARSRALTVTEDELLSEAINRMRRRHATCILVCKKEKLSGIFTERDFLLKAAGDAAAFKRPVREFMTANPACAELDESLGRAIELMNAKHLRHLPIVDASGHPVSVITVDSVIRYLADLYPAAVLNRPPSPDLAASETDGA